jgi:hypothetical protein
VLRLFESLGLARDAAITSHFPIRTVVQANALEQESEQKGRVELRSESEITVSMKPFELKTLLIEF